MIYHVNRDFSVYQGSIEKTEVLPASGPTALQITDNTYINGNTVGLRLTARDYGTGGAESVRTYQSQSVITRGSDTYTTSRTFETNPAASDFAYGAPEQVDQTSSTAPGLTRTADYLYTHFKTPWILGLTKKVTRNGKVFEEHTHNSDGLLLNTKTFGTQTATYTYAGDGTLSTFTNALNHQAGFSSYKRGIPQTVNLPDGASYSRIVDDNGWVTSETNARGNTFGIGYDNMGRLTSVNRPGVWADTTVAYSNLGNGIVQTATRGNSRSVSTYDGMYRPTLMKSEDLTGHSAARHIKTSYDGLSQVTFSSQPSTSSNPSAGINTSYDALGRVTQTAETVAPYATTGTAYLSGNQVRVTDPIGAQTTTTYRAFGAPATDEAMQVVDATGGITTITRDIYGNIAQLNQSGSLNGWPVGVDRYFWYDNRFNLCRHRAPELGDEVFSYDNAGQLTMSSRGEAAGAGCTIPGAARRISYSYDALGRQTLIDLPSGHDDILKTYDANGNILTTNRNGSNWTYTYDELDQLSGEYLTLDGRAYSIIHARNSSGHMDSRAHPGGLVETFTPDGFGQRRAVGFGGLPYAFSLTYHPNGSPASGAFGNGATFSQSLTSRLQPYDIKVQGTSGTLVDLRHGYDARGKISSITDYVVAGQNKTFQYDGRGRLTTANGPWGNGALYYDSIDNLRVQNYGGRSIETWFDSATNRVWRVRDTNTGFVFGYYSYDPSGNTTSNGAITLAHDWTNQPVTMVGAGVNNTYTYDGNLKRVKSVQNGKTTYWIYSALTGTPVYADEVTDNIQTHYLSAGGGQIRIKNGIAEYTHFDHQGSPVAATDTVGNLTWREHYTPFGEKWQSDFANDNDIGYTGHVQDHASGLTYMQARYYDPVIGRFLSTDPIGYQDQINQYAYVANDPVNNIDPNGEWTVRLYAEGIVGGGSKNPAGSQLKGQTGIAIGTNEKGKLEIRAFNSTGGAVGKGSGVGLGTAVCPNCDMSDLAGVSGTSGELAVDTKKGFDVGVEGSVTNGKLEAALEIGVGNAAEGAGVMKTSMSGDAVAGTQALANDVGDALSGANQAMRTDPGGTMHKIAGGSGPPPPPLPEEETE